MMLSWYAILPKGTLDPAFNGSGWVTTDFFADDLATAVVLQPDGKIVRGRIYDHRKCLYLSALSSQWYPRSRLR